MEKMADENKKTNREQEIKSYEQFATMIFLYCRIKMNLDKEIFKVN